MIGIIMYPGSNCAEDTKRYFPNSFFIWHTESEWKPMDLLVIPGGFAFGDRDYEYATHEYKIDPGKKAKDSPVSKIIMKAYEKGIPILGICNGFQILIQMGLLPGRLCINKKERFICKSVACELANSFKDDTDKFQTLEVANSYGRYVPNEDFDDSQIIVKYCHNYVLENGSCIGGVCDKNKRVFGMMPHPERTNNKAVKDIILRIMNDSKCKKLSILKEKFKHEIKNLMNSEHISYKSTRKYLKNLYTQGSHVIQGPGENAGIIDIGDGYALALRIESHNHPTFIDPYHGASTGVGGIIRDIFTMGARPIALLDFLRFGSDSNSNRLLNESVRGIADYGNCIGIANVGGDCYIDETYKTNPLVNVGCIGIMKKENIVYGNVKNDGDVLIYVGRKTGNDGINGAAMASNEFKANTDVDSLKDNIQHGDAFLEKLLMEACLEIVEAKLLQGMQDMGAGGLLCSSLEVVQRGRTKYKENFGCVINVDSIPEVGNMDSCDKLISESQERMLLVSKPECVERIFEIFNKWELEYSVVGNVNLTGKYKVISDDGELFSENVSNFDDPIEEWPTDNVSNVSKVMPEYANNDLWTNYDKSIGGRSIKIGRGNLYTILDLREVNKKLVIAWGDDFDTCYYNVIWGGGKPVGLVNCLNYGHPKDSIGDMAAFLEELTTKCRKYDVPVLGGNVSLYNATDGKSIIPSPILMMIGLIG
jgi:phosphoribosylformylglycinamidine (FGAM) synthase-like amidotransferase family enzyme/selenophosphate synthetase-related protein